MRLSVTWWWWWCGGGHGLASGVILGVILQGLNFRLSFILTVLGQFLGIIPHAQVHL